MRPFDSSAGISPEEIQVYVAVRKDVDGWEDRVQRNLQLLPVSARLGYQYHPQGSRLGHW